MLYWSLIKHELARESVCGCQGPRSPHSVSLEWEGKERSSFLFLFFAAILHLGQPVAHAPGQHVANLTA